MQQTILSKVVYSDGQAVDTFTEDVNQKLANGWKLVHLSNTPFSILITLLGIVILVKLEHL